MHHAIRLARAVECARHEGVILRRVAEHHQLGRAHAHVIFCLFGGGLDDGAHHLHGVHVDAAFGRAHIYAGTHKFRLRQRIGNAADKPFIPCGKALVHQGRIPANEVYAHGFGGGVQRAGIPHGVCIRRAGQQHGNGRHRHALVHNGHAVSGRDALGRAHKVFCARGDFVVNFFACAAAVRVRTVQQGDAHGDGAHVQVFVRDHANGVQDVVCIQHGGLLTPCAWRRTAPDGCSGYPPQAVCQWRSFFPKRP